MEGHKSTVLVASARTSSFTIVERQFKKSSRGVTTWKEVNIIDGKKWKITFKDGQLVGAFAQKLSTACGLYARSESYFLIYKEWEGQKPNSLDVLADMQKEYFEFVDPNGLEMDVVLVVNWIRCALQKTRVMLERVKLGPNYSELATYLTQHKKKNGEYPNEYTMEMCEQVRERSDLMGISSSLEPTVLRPVLDDVFGGHHEGYERGQGFGYSRSLMKDTPEHRASCLSVGLVHARLQQLASENEDLKEKMAKQHEDSLKQEGEMCEMMPQLRALV